MRISNFYPDLNRFQLAAPPKWWLEELWCYDVDAVILPSRQEACFRLTRRSKRAPRLLDGRYTHPLVSMMPSPDTIMCAEYGVVPALTITPMSGWTPDILKAIVERDMWRVGGWKGTEKILLEKEEKERVETKKRISDMVDEGAGDYYRRLVNLTGSRASYASLDARPSKMDTAGPKAPVNTGLRAPASKPLNKEMKPLILSS